MNTEIKIAPAQKAHANDIAKLIMDAMNHECCQFFAGPDHTLAEFEAMMTELVGSEHSQYSYRNTLVALAGSTVAGICVTYNGADLHDLRQAFVAAAQKYFGRDFSQMADETSAGELYLDSLAVHPDFRRRGIASALLRAAAEKARSLQIPAVGLLVDAGNPQAEKLYTQAGFRLKNTNTWGGHAMKHLQLEV